MLGSAWLVSGLVAATIGSLLATVSGVYLEPEEEIDWENAPRVDLVARTFAGGVNAFWNIFLPTYLVSRTVISAVVSRGVTARDKT